MNDQKLQSLTQYLHNATSGQGAVDLSWVCRHHPAWPFAAASAPTTATLTRAFAQDAAYRAIELGTWFNTTDGELIEAAVVRALPYPENAEAKIVIEALKAAADLQHKQRGAAIGAGFVVAALVFGMVFARL